MKNADIRNLNKVVETIFYTDRLVLWFIKKPRGLKEQLEGHCGRVNTPPIKGVDLDKYKRSEKHKFLSNCHYQLDIKQPTDDALKIISKILWASGPRKYIKVGCMVTHFEPAVDFVTKNIHDAEEIANYLDGRLNHDFSQGEKIEKNIYKKTIYWNKENPKITLVLYYDKLSKIAVKPCAHLEYRFECAEALDDEINICGSNTRFNNIYNIIDKFDHNIFWKRHLNLLEPESGSIISNEPFIHPKIRRIQLIKRSKKIKKIKKIKI